MEVLVLRRHGDRTAPGATQSFYVVDVQGPLVEGELDRPRQCGMVIGRAAVSGASRSNTPRDGPWPRAARDCRSAQNGSHVS